jgi:hypothetical protein
MRRALLTVFAAVLFTVAPQQTCRTSDLNAASGFALYRPEILTTVDSSALVRDLPMTELLDGRVPGSSLLGRMGTAPVANFPVALVSAAPARKTSASSTSVKDPKDGKDYSSSEALAVEKASLTWTGGELGVFYGHSSGKFGGDDFGSYILGTVGNDKFQITVGTSYEESNLRIPRRP